MREHSEAAATGLLDSPPDRDGVTVLLVLEAIFVVQQGHFQDGISIPTVPKTRQMQHVSVVARTTSWLLYQLSAKGGTEYDTRG